jgi:hypothetical protein
MRRNQDPAYRALREEGKRIERGAADDEAFDYGHNLRLTSALRRRYPYCPTCHQRHNPHLGCGWGRTRGGPPATS